MRRLLALAAVVAAASAQLAAAARYNYCHAENLSVGRGAPDAAAYTPNSSAPFPPPPRGATLVLAQAIIRHGDRTPTVSFDESFSILRNESETWNCNLNGLSIIASGDNDTETSFDVVNRLFRLLFLEGRQALPGNCMLGELTTIGSLQHVQLGGFLRERYVNQLNFLDDDLTSSQVWCRSTNVYRTIQSAQSLFAGMFPSASQQIFDIHSIDSNTDNMTPNPVLCPALNELGDKAYSDSETWNKYYDDVVEPFMRYVSEATSIPTSQLSGLSLYFDLFDLMNAQYCHNMDMPGSLSEDSIEQINEITPTWFGVPMNSSYYNSLAIGSFVAELLENIQSAVQSWPSVSGAPKFRLFSGHDTTIAPIMGLFGIFTEWPPYASNVLLELWQYNNNMGSYFVTFTYNGQAIQLPGCSSVNCLLDEFVDVVSKSIPTNFKADCAASDERQRMLALFREWQRSERFAFN